MSHGIASIGLATDPCTIASGSPSPYTGFPGRAECTIECAKTGDLALVVKDAGKDKVITLTGVSAVNKAALLKLAGKNAKVTGTVTGDQMTVTKVEAATVVK